MASAIFLGAFAIVALGLISMALFLIISPVTPPEASCFVRRFIGFESEVCTSRKIVRKIVQEDVVEMALSDDNMVFFAGKERVKYSTLVVGIIYKEAKGQGGIAGGFCWATQDAGGYDPRFLVSRMGPDGQITPVQGKPPKNFIGTWSETDFAKARLACPWPKQS